jgi:hypothetical protein
VSDDRLRTALRELGDVPPPAGLAAGALARARRDRRRGALALAATVVLATAAAILAPATLRTRAPAPPAAPPPAGPPAAVWVSAYLTVTPRSGSDPLWQAQVYDPATRRYRAVPVSEARLVTVSPDGSQAVVAPPGAGADRMAVVRLDRLTAGLTAADWRQPRLPKAQWWTWSPDGTRLLSGDVAYRPTAAVVVDVRTRGVTEVPLQLDELRSGEHGLAWGPGGRGFVTWRSTRGEEHPAPGEVVSYDEGGRPIRRYPLPALCDEVQLSPDGSRALVISRMPDPPARPDDQSWLLDLRTGATSTLTRSPDYWYADGLLVRIDVPQRGAPSVAVVEPDGERVRRRTALALPAGAQLTGVLVAHGGPPLGAIVL